MTLTFLRVWNGVHFLLGMDWLLSRCLVSPCPIQSHWPICWLQKWTVSLAENEPLQLPHMCIKVFQITDHCHVRSKVYVAQHERTIENLCHCPLIWESTCDRWISLKKAVMQKALPSHDVILVHIRYCWIHPLMGFLHHVRGKRNVRKHPQNQCVAVITQTTNKHFPPGQCCWRWRFGLLKGQGTFGKIVCFDFIAI